MAGERYTLKNGVLHKNGRPVLALGTSYYPSFHKAKFPVPPDGDREGEMKKDLRLMREKGFNFLRTAALGDVTYEDGAVRVSTPFIDRMLDEAEADGLAACVRLQGYVMNLRGWTDYLMLNEKDEPQDGSWSAFIRNSLHHEGILEDNRMASEALARHFRNRRAAVSYQIYNEPHYPYNGVFDYHPASIAAFRKWLADEGYMTAAEAEACEPPRSRPGQGEDGRLWVLWRLFGMRSLSSFLADSAQACRKGAPDREMLTCLTSTATTDRYIYSGVSYFDDARDMDAVGVTLYTHFEGADYYQACYLLDLAVSAAAVYGKHAWMIELDARTGMPACKGLQSTYATVGAGCKGIVYYEWRGDYPAEGTPLPDNCVFFITTAAKPDTRRAFLR